MVFSFASVTAEGAACLNFFTVNGVFVEDKPTPSGSVQNRQLLIFQSARPLCKSFVMQPSIWWDCRL